MHTDLNSPFIALVGPPNAGKTTLFNWLTGRRSKAVNYPGATVELAVGPSLEQFGPSIDISDTPGTYSLFPKSYEERVTVDLLFSENSQFKPARLVVVVDSTQMHRHLNLAHQLREAGYDFVIALTMADLLTSDEKELHLEDLQRALQCPVIPVDGRLGGGVKELLAALHEEGSPQGPVKLPEPWSPEKYESMTEKNHELYEKIYSQSSRDTTKAADWTRRLDQWVLHPFWGLVLFFLTMTLLFSSIFWLAAPFMDALDSAFGELAQVVLSQFPGSLFADFLANGIIAGFGAFLVFTPQILILFLGLSFLEDTGYLARAATLIDKPLSKMGLNGRCFVPILSGYACAVPAMMAARNIPSRRERLLTLFLLPLMTCSARLPVYALLIAFLFASAWIGGLTMAALYIGSFVLAVIVAKIASRFIEDKDSSFFLLELPFYRWPRWMNVIKHSWRQTVSFMTRAGPVIFVLSLVIWAATTLPHYEIQDDAERLSQSYAAQVGQWIEPIMQPMGLDWRAGVGILSSFAAREVFVSTLALIFNVAGEEEAALQSSLLKAMQNATMNDGTPVFTFASVVGLILFYMIALQCVATVSIAKKESGSWGFALTQLIAFNIAGYLAAVVAYQALSTL